MRFTLLDTLRGSLFALLAAAPLALAGTDGALSAAVGGAISMGAGYASAVVASKGRKQSAGDVLIGALLAEAVKIGLERGLVQ